MAAWVKKVGNASKILAGFPAYSTSYSGAKKRGDAFDARKSTVVQLSDIPEKDIRPESPDGDSYGANVDGNWTSVVPPVQVADTLKKLRTEYPTLGGAMVWSAEGCTDALGKALTQK